MGCFLLANAAVVTHKMPPHVADTCWFTHLFPVLQDLCPTLAPGSKVVINLSGRGDKDVHTAAQYLDISGNIDEEIKDLSSQRNM